MAEVARGPKSQSGRRAGNNLIETFETSAPWYSPHPGPRLTPERRLFYVQYTGLKDEELEQHLSTIRNRAWKLRPFPFIGSWLFLHSYMSLMPAYPSVVSRVKDGALILDVGCGLGQDLRELVAAGCPSNHMFASDVIPGFWDIGFDLFCDRDKFDATFLLADVFDRSSSLEALRGNMDIIYLGLVLHLYGWEQQRNILTSLVPLTKVGSVVFGCGMGLPKGSEIDTHWNNATKTMYYHDEETMQQLWKPVGEVTGTKWEVKPKSFPMDSFPIEKEDYDWIGQEVRMSTFEAVRVA